MYSYRRNDSTSRERALQDEIDSLREQESRRMEREEQKRKEREREAREEWNYSMRTADSWPEALRKQSILCGKEAADEWEDDPNAPPGFFTSTAAACDEAGKLWAEVAASRQSDIERLQAQLSAVQDEIRETVAERLRQHPRGGETGFKDVVSALSNNVNLENWLNW